MPKLFGQQVREERLKQGQTVQVIATACGVSRSYMTLIENGKRFPAKKNLSKIAAALHIKSVVVLDWYLEDIKQRLLLTSH